MANVVAGDIFAVLREFDGKAVVGALVQPRKIAFDDEASLQFETADLRQIQRVEVSLWIIHKVHLLRVEPKASALGSGLFLRIAESNR